MAKKVKTPPPPRRAVQAPKQRSAPRDDARNRKLIYAIGASGFIMLALVVGFFMLAGNDEGEGAQGAVAELRAAGWTYQKAKDQGRDHVPVFTDKFKYNTVPGTSGEHSNQTVIYGAYDQPVSEINYVHNLEHGAIGMFYGPDVSEAQVARMQEYYAEDPNGLIMAPDSRLGDKIALTAWTHIAKGETFTPEAADTFIDAFGFRAPESCKNDIEQGCFRRSNMEPGNQ